MRLQFVEVTNGFNFGKFAVGKFEHQEWVWPSHVEAEDSNASIALLRRCGWAPDSASGTDVYRLVLDLQTGEGAVFRIGGYAKADLDKHRVWVCPMFEPFLTWLYEQPDVDDLPSLVRLSEDEAPSDWAGYRRSGVGDG